LLSYLTKLSANGVELGGIPRSAHFAMYSNPVAMWERIAEFDSRGKPVRAARKHISIFVPPAAAGTRSACPKA
jgi:hypothetical protein